MDATIRTVLGRDRRMRRLLDRHGPAPIGQRPLFDAMLRAVVSQQISTSAARAITTRIEERVGRRADDVLRVRTATLHRCGLSRSKAACLRELARRKVAGEFRRMGRLSDEAVREHLGRTKGVGPWTVDMIMMFALGRPDVWPVGDAGIQRAGRELYGVERDGLDELGERFRPYRSHAAWYFWRALG